jgi:hypothetical protein
VNGQLGRHLALARHGNLETPSRRQHIALSLSILWRLGYTSLSWANMTGVKMAGMVISRLAGWGPTRG